MGYNSAQQQAIEEAGHTLVLAPPGSGKTGTLVGKCVHIIRQSPNTKVALMTFTAAATQELQERVAKALTKSEMSRVDIGTFHHFCMDMLAKAKLLGKLLPPPSQPTAIRQAMSSAAYPGKYEEAAGEIQRAKRSLDFTGRESPLIEAYESFLRRHRASDLDDVVRIAALALRDGRIKPLPVTHLLSDEYQDADKTQSTFTVGHGKSGVITTVVADDDQSIYSFRGSLGYDALTEFETECNATRICLEINYRSNSEILKAAEAVIINNTNRVEKNVVSHRGPGGQVYVKRVPSRPLECQAVSRILMSSMAQDDGSVRVAEPGEWAIIARTNGAFRLLVGELKCEGIAYYRIGGKDDLPEDAEVFMNFLNSLQTGDSIGVEAMLIRAGVNPHTAATAIASCDGHCLAFLEGIPAELDRPDPEDAKLVKEVATRCQAWRNYLTLGHYERVIDGVAFYFLDNGLVKSSTPDEDFKFWVELLKRGRGSLTRRTERLMRKKEEKSKAGVALVTMHSSKGLEFENVIVIQANTGTIPSPNNPLVEEERRLFFVAITRAKRHLTVMAQRQPLGSPFVDEMERSGVVHQLAN